MVVLLVGVVIMVVVELELIIGLETEVGQLRSSGLTCEILKKSRLLEIARSLEFRRFLDVCCWFSARNLLIALFWALVHCTQTSLWALASKVLLQLSV